MNTTGSAFGTTLPPREATFVLAIVPLDLTALTVWMLPWGAGAEAAIAVPTVPRPAVAATKAPTHSNFFTIFTAGPPFRPSRLRWMRDDVTNPVFSNTLEILRPVWSIPDFQA